MLHMHVPVRYTKANSLHMTWLKTPPPAGAWKDIDICLTRWKFQLNFPPLYAHT